MGSCLNRRARSYRCGLLVYLPGDKAGCALGTDVFSNLQRTRYTFLSFSLSLSLSLFLSLTLSLALSRGCHKRRHIWRKRPGVYKTKVPPGSTIELGDKKKKRCDTRDGNGTQWCGGTPHTHTHIHICSGLLEENICDSFERTEGKRPIWTSLGVLFSDGPYDYTLYGVDSDPLGVCVCVCV